jgi:DNA polymerase-3 subunit gamma/tau
LEEPPEHVYFILATTNPEKLIDTIRSRTTQILFRNANDKEIKRALEKVVSGERIKIDNDTMALIADAAKGSLRDSHKLLERIVSEYGKKVSYKEAERLLFVNKAPEIEKILGYLMNKDVEGALHEIERAVVSGIAIDFYTEILVKKLRAGLLAKNGLGKDFLSEMTVSELVELITLIQESYYFQKDAIIEQLPLELAIIKWCGESEKKVEIPAQNDNPKSSKGGEKPGSNSKSEKKVAIKTRKKALDNDHMTNNAVLDESVWIRILSGLRPANTSIEALLRSAKPIDYDGSTLKLGVYYSFHKERLEEESHRKILEDVIEKIVGNRIRVICILTKPPKRSVEKNIKEEVVLTEDDGENIVKVAEEIFGN